MNFLKLINFRSAIILRSAFPKSLRGELNVILETLPWERIPPSKQIIGPINMQDEVLHIPSRVYFSEPDQAGLEEATAIRKYIYAAIFTRHHDGFVRQRNLRRLLPCEKPWVPAFVTQLLGEYVVEIIVEIGNHARLLPKEPYSQFIAANPPFIEITKKRIVSYWSCYYRQQFPAFREYPGFQVADSLGLWSDREKKRILAS
jgi:hypothetical protein